MIGLDSELRLAFFKSFAHKQCWLYPRSLWYRFEVWWTLTCDSKAPLCWPSLRLSPALGRTHLCVLVNEVMGMKTATACYASTCPINGEAPSQGDRAGHTLSFRLRIPCDLWILLPPTTLRVWGSEAM